MNEYDIVAVLWQDHHHATQSPIPDNLDEYFDLPTLSVGILLRETPSRMFVVSDIERYEERDDATYTVILKNNIVGVKKYGSIELEDIRTERAGM